jgi:Flp pilus assembly protein TadD
MRRLKEAEEFYLLAVSLEPRNARWRQNLGDLYARQGRIAPARNEYRESARLLQADLVLNPHNRPAGLRLALCLAKSGDCGKAEQSLAALMPSLPADDAQHAHSIARIHAVCGRRRDAIASVRRAIELGFSPKMIRDDDEFRSLASDPEFLRLVGGGPPGR